MLASVLTACLFGVPLAIAVLKWATQHERGHLAQTASAVAIETIFSSRARALSSDLARYQARCLLGDPMP